MVLFLSGVLEARILSSLSFKALWHSTSQNLSKKALCHLNEFTIAFSQCTLKLILTWRHEGILRTLNDLLEQ